MKKKKAGTFVYYGLMVFLMGVFCFSGWKLISEMKSYNDDKQAYKELEQFVEVPVINQVQQDEHHEEEPELQIPIVDFESLISINKDCIGWIYVPDTNINYPVVQTTNNEYYLKRLFDRKYGISGTVFLDSGNTSEMTDRHSILYGHHMKNGTMFANAEDYKDQSYADAHPYGYYITPDAVYEIKFFAGYLTDPYNDSWDLDFTGSEFADWISRAKQRSHFYTDITPGNEDRIITLSTCSYDIADGRFVLLGILRELD